MIPLEDKDSWRNFVKKREDSILKQEVDSTTSSSYGSINRMEEKKEWGDYRHATNYEYEYDHDRRHLNHQKIAKKRRKKLDELLNDPGIQVDTMHGLIIDAGSTGSRMHVYEFKKRVLEGEKEISEAVSGKKLSYPGTDTRWTDRLRPGLATFSTKSDEELVPAIAAYLKPLIKFAEAVLYTKQNEWPQFPIYLKATAGMRMLEQKQRIRIITAVRQIFNDPTYSKFKFEITFARVISGEEEAIYGWAGANFVLGSLLQSSEGSGTVVNPKLTHGALDMGGASAQISFYQDNEDIMSNLFKLQIGQGKHWNVYAHSHLCFGVNEAWDRMGAFLSTNDSLDVQTSVHNPCLAGGMTVDFESSTYFQDGNAHWRVDNNDKLIPYTTTMVNKNKRGDYNACAKLANAMLNKQQNQWCTYSHHGDCSFSGVYQPQLPLQSKNFGEFLAFSNYYHIWDFLKLPKRSSLSTLQEGARKICSMDVAELKKWNNDTIDTEDLSKMCFRASYAFQLLRNGYGFNMEDNITATHIVNGQKIGWALGSMLYEINTLPWKYVPRMDVEEFDTDVGGHVIHYYLGALLICVSLGFYYILRSSRTRQRQHHFVKHQYSSIDNVELEPERS